jgi:hypothetical protein
VDFGLQHAEYDNPVALSTITHAKVLVAAKHAFSDEGLLKFIIVTGDEERIVVHRALPGRNPTAVVKSDIKTAI